MFKEKWLVNIVKIKKYLVMAVKFVIGNLPKKLKNILKGSPKLTSFYSRMLQRSGLFYGFPSRVQLEKLYSRNIAFQQQQIDEIVQNSVDNALVEVVIFISEYNFATLQTTLASVKQASITELTLVSSTKGHPELLSRLQHDFPELMKVRLVTLAQLASLANIATAKICLYCGEQIHQDASKVFKSFLPNFDIVYCDSDIIDCNKRQTPKFLPDWNPDLQLTTYMVQTGVIIAPNVPLTFFASDEVTRTTIAEALSSMYLLHQNLAIGHVPLVLVHRPQGLKSVVPLLSKPYLKRLAQSAECTHSDDKSCLRLSWHMPDTPLVSLIIPTKNAKGLVKVCIESILRKTSYKHYEIILVDNNSDESDSLDYFDELALHPQIRVLKYSHPFNYSAINNFAVTHAKGEIIGLVNNDIEVITPEWLTHMMGHVMRHDIGCVGGKLLYADGRVQHAGVVMGYGGGAGHAHKYFPRYHPGYLNRLAASGNFSAVTAACLLVKKNDFLAVGGLNEKELSIAFNDVDFCLKVMELGRRNLYCAEAELYHYESVSRGHDDTKEKQQRFQSELNYLKTNWASFIKHDPAYNPNLTLRRENFSISED